MENNKENKLKEKLNRLSFTKKQLRIPEISYPVPLQKETSSPLVLLAFYHKSSNYYNVVDYGNLYGNTSYHFPVFKEKEALEHGLFFTGSIIKETTIDGKSLPDLLESEELQIDVSEKLLKGTKISPENYIIGLRIDNEIKFYQVLNGKITQCNTDAYSLTLDVFSRNTGLIESAMMKDKTVIISGCGSVGSYVGLELARSGVGNFVLIDNDIISYANVCRHQCNIADVGRYKTEAVADRIKLINPQANVHTENLMIENVPPDVFQKHSGPDSIIVGCADNRQGDIFANKIATHAGMPIVSIGFWERAFAGEIFFWYPENKGLACYHCFTDALGDLSGRTSTNRRYYTTEEDLSKVSFMPGVSVDITFITNIGVKIILDILNRSDQKFIPRLIDSLEQFTLIANTNKTEIGGDQASIFSYPLQVTTSIEVVKDHNCPFCGIKQ